MSVIGDNIRALRKLNGEMTQQALADAIGVTRETVNKWEMGSIGNVRTSNVDALRSIFGLSVDDLRSESRGLAARQSDLTAADVGRSRIPVLHLADLMGKTLRTDATCFVDISPALFDRHPRAFALFIDGPSMNSILPEGCHARDAGLRVSHPLGNLGEASAFHCKKKRLALDCIHVYTANHN